jgi:hypothetical protein
MFQYTPRGLYLEDEQRYVDRANGFLFDHENDGIFTKRIEEDRKYFRDIISGKLRKELRKLIDNGGIVKNRGKGGKVILTIPRINIPHIVFGDNGENVGRGKGKKGDVIGRDKGEGEGSDAGDSPGEGIRIAVDLEDVLKFLQQELGLPDMKPKQNETFEEVKIKYNDISLTGPESLRHSRRTYKQALKRTAGTGELGKLQNVPGFACPMPVIEVQKSDKRYRQYTEIKIPSSNAVIFYARDWSGSMDAWRCDCVSDVVWWIDCWIRRFYKRTERVWIGHDTDAQETDENTFYNYRYGGGTMCSSALKFIERQLKNRFQPKTWNIYVFYFTDGENWGGDNEIFFKTLKEALNPNIVNMVGITQVAAWNYNRSVKGFVDSHLTPEMDNVRTVSIGKEESPDGWGGYGNRLDEETRNKEIMRAIKVLLGKDSKAKVKQTEPVGAI